MASCELKVARELLAQGKSGEAEDVLVGCLSQNAEISDQDREAAVLLRSRCIAFQAPRFHMDKSSHPALMAARIRNQRALLGSKPNPGGASTSRARVGRGAGTGAVEKRKADEADAEDREWLIDAQTTPQLQHWDIGMLVAISYVAIATPYEVAFLEPEINAIFVVNRMVDMVFLCDLILQFFITAQDERGNWVKNRGMIAQMYLRSWFAIDVISLLPFDIIGLLVSADAVSQFKAIRAVRILRLIKLLRIIRSSRIIKRWENHYSINYAVLGLSQYMVFILLATHWFACLYHLVAYIQGVGTNTWIDQQDTAVDNNWQVYILSISWAAQTISSIGYGDALATTTAERVMVILMMLVGSAIFAFALGEISYTVQQLSRKEDHYHETIDNVNSFTDEVDLPLVHRVRCREFIKHKYTNNTLSDQQSALSELSQALREEVAMHTHSSWMQKVDFFKGCPSGFVVAVASVMELKTYSANEKIYSCGQTVSHMWVINKGVVAKSGHILQQGSLIGIEMTYLMLYRPVLYAENARALTFSDLYALSWESFRDCLSDYPLVFPQVRKIAIKAVFRKHVLSFSAACRNYAGDQMSRTRDSMILSMERELLSKKEARVRGLKGEKPIAVDQNEKKIRPQVAQQLAATRMEIANLNKRLQVLEPAMPL